MAESVIQRPASTVDDPFLVAALEADVKLLAPRLHISVFKTIRLAAACARSHCLRRLVKDKSRLESLGISKKAVKALIARYRREETLDPHGYLIYRRLRRRPAFKKLKVMHTTAKASSRTAAEHASGARSYINALKAEFKRLRQCRHVYQLDEVNCQWFRVDELFATAATTRARMDQVKLGGTREAVSMLPIINCESTRAIVWVAASGKTAKKAADQVAAGVGLSEMAFSNEKTPVYEQRVVVEEGGPVFGDGAAIADAGTLPIPAADADDILVAQEEDTAGDAAEPADDEPATAASASASSSSSSSSSAAGGAPSVTQAAPAPAPRSTARRQRQSKDQRPPRVMSAKHLPGVATIRMMDKDGILHLFYGSENGWVTRSIFRDAMRRWVEWEAKNDATWAAEPKLLLMDGHPAHVDTDAIRLLERTGMRCLFPPGASSHMWQVLDNGPFGCFRREFSRLRVCASDVAARGDGIVVCPATIMAVKRGKAPGDVKVLLELDRADDEEADASESSTPAPTSVLVKLKAKPKDKVHSSDTLCAAYFAWCIAATPAMLRGGWLHTGTFVKDFRPDSKPTCDPQKIMERLKEHCGEVDKAKITEEATLQVATSIGRSGPGLAAADSRHIQQEIAAMRVASNFGIAEEEDGTDRAKRSRFNRDARQLVARTTTDILSLSHAEVLSDRRLLVQEADQARLEAEAAAGKTATELQKALKACKEQLKSLRREAAATKKEAKRIDAERAKVEAEQAEIDDLRAKAEAGEAHKLLSQRMMGNVPTPPAHLIKARLRVLSPEAAALVASAKRAHMLMSVGYQTLMASAAPPTESAASLVASTGPSEASEVSPSATAEAASSSPARTTPAAAPAALAAAPASASSSSAPRRVSKRLRAPSWRAEGQE